MSPEDQTPQKPVTPDSTSNDPRPTPWMPPSEDGSANTPENTGVTELVDTAGVSSKSSESPAESFDSSAPDSSQSGETTPVSPAETAAPSETGFTSSDGTAMFPTGQPVTPPTPQTPLQPPISPLSPPDQPTPFDTTPSTTPPQPTPGNVPSSKGKLLKLVILVVILVAVVAAGFFGYKAIKHKNQTASVNSALGAATAKQKSTNTTDVSTLNDIKFSIPDSALAALTKQPSTGAGPNVSLYTTADGNCFVAFGTGTSTGIKGNNVSEIVNNYLDNIRKTGATVATPMAADPRTFMDAKDPSKMYSMPSLNLSFTQGKEQGQGYYSGSLLKGGNRAIVETACDNKNGAVDQSEMTTVSNIAKQLMITVQ